MWRLRIQDTVEIDQHHSPSSQPQIMLISDSFLMEVSQALDFWSSGQLQLTLQVPYHLNLCHVVNILQLVVEDVHMIQLFHLLGHLGQLFLQTQVSAMEIVPGWMGIWPLGPLGNVYSQFVLAQALLLQAVALVLALLFLALILLLLALVLLFLALVLLFLALVRLFLALVHLFLALVLLFLVLVLLLQVPEQDL